MAKVLLVGYSGHKNFGDDLLLKQAHSCLKDISDVSIWTDVTGKKSDYLDFWFPQATIIRSKKLGLRIFKKFDRVLYFGGGVFFDYKENYPKILFVKKTLSIVKNYYLSRLYGVHFAGIGIGLGPFNSKYSSYLTRLQLRVFDFIGVRDNVSFEFLIHFGLEKKAIKGYDLSFLQHREISTTKTEQIKKILICPRRFHHQCEKDHYHKQLIDWVLKLKESGVEILVFGFQPEHDESVLLEYQKAGLNTKVWDPERNILAMIFELFEQYDLIISSRMHGVYVAGMVNRPCIGIEVHPKVKDATELFDKSHCLPASFQIKELEETISKLGIENSKAKKLYTYKKSATSQYQMVKKWINIPPISS